MVLGGGDELRVRLKGGRHVELAEELLEEREAHGEKPLLAWAGGGAARRASVPPGGHAVAVWLERPRAKGFPARGTLSLRLCGTAERAELGVEM